MLSSAPNIFIARRQFRAQIFKSCCSPFTTGCISSCSITFPILLLPTCPIHVIGTSPIPGTSNTLWCSCLVEIWLRAGECVRLRGSVCTNGALTYFLCIDIALTYFLCSSCSGHSAAEKVTYMYEICVTYYTDNLHLCVTMGWFKVHICSAKFSHSSHHCLAPDFSKYPATVPMVVVSCCRASLTSAGHTRLGTPLGNPD